MAKQIKYDSRFDLEQVRKLIYQAYKFGQGGHVEINGSRLSLQNRRMYDLRRLFPKIFFLPARQKGRKRKTAAAVSAVAV